MKLQHEFYGHSLPAAHLLILVWTETTTFLTFCSFLTLCSCVVVTAVTSSWETLTRTQWSLGGERVFGSSVGLEHKAWQVLLQDGGLLSVWVVDGNFAVLQAGQRPVAHRQLSGTHSGQDGLTGCYRFHLTPCPLQLLQELTARLCTRRGEEKREIAAQKKRRSKRGRPWKEKRAHQSEHWSVCVYSRADYVLKASDWFITNKLAARLRFQ